MTVITRFAPSPTGFLHVGGARTALFNWLFANHHKAYGEGGEFLLRIEDTDRNRSTKKAVDAIFDGLSWLGLNWDHDVIFQVSRVDRHLEAIEQLLTSGHAYRCYCSPEELAEMREQARAQGLPMMYNGKWRDRDPADAPAGVAPTIRLRSSKEGITKITDHVQGEISVKNETLDDMILLRSDGTPTYMLAVVVDDHDMAVTHVIRGDDHLTNAFRQTQLFEALGWNIPVFAHIPLIHAADGSKLSKRHGALGVEAYRDMGFLPDAICNYLLRLGWSHGDDEIISRDQAIEWFSLNTINKSAARFDVEKLTSINSEYIQSGDTEILAKLIMPLLQTSLKGRVSEYATERLNTGLASIKYRSKNLIELAEKSVFYAKNSPIDVDDKARKILTEDTLSRLRDILKGFADITDWQKDILDCWLNTYIENADIKMGEVAQPLRAALTGTTASPGITEVLSVLGKHESIRRLEDVTRV